MISVAELAVAALASAAMTITIMLLPAIIELKKPRDAGPRLIQDKLGYSPKCPIAPIMDLEDDWKSAGSQLGSYFLGYEFNGGSKLISEEQPCVLPLVFSHRYMSTWATMD